MPSLPPRDWHVINLPGFTISVQQMLDDLVAIAGKDILARVKPQFDEGINAIVASWPAAIDNSTALKADFRVDSDFQSVIRQFIEKDLRK